MISLPDGQAEVAARAPAKALDVARIRADFPILRERINGNALIYMDNAATAQKPQAVIDAVSHYYQHDNANIHRGVHQLSVRATAAYERARRTVQKFIGAERPEEIIFVRSATEAINLVAQTFCRARVRPGDEIVISTMEHHSNIVPWQLLCEQTGAVLRIVPINDAGELLLDDYEKLLGPKTKLVSMGHVSNSIGTIAPIQEVIKIAHSRGIPVLVDGCQAVPHFAVNVRVLDSDFYTFSGHKLFGPTGIGILHGKLDLLEHMPVYQTGGDMIKFVSFEKTTYNDLPHRFEAGTPNIAGAIGLAAAMEYLSAVSMDEIAVYERGLLAHATEALADIPEVRLIGTARNKASVVSFVVEGIHPHDVGTILDQEGIAVRTGHHCAQPVMQRFNVPATTRASLAFYNTREEIDVLVAALRQVVRMFK